MSVGLGALGLAPRDFWQLSVVEFNAAVQGRFGEVGEADPMRRHDFETLMQRFPDK